MYLPWPGLFDQIKNCDVFIHYDDATLPQGRSFISRVQVKNNDTLGWMTIPIKKSKLPINQILIDNENNWKKNHIKRIKKSLENTSFFNIAFELIQDLEKVEFNNISELNIYYIEKISRFLGFNTEFRISSDYKLDLQATEKLIQICKINHATKYITGHGAINYICHESFEKEKIEVNYMKYNILNYLNQNQDFTPYCTILDLIGHQGSSASKYMKSELVYWKDFIRKEVIKNK
tara:strand:+ start:96 stop:797 length:702 start_codon:yes stop_codon:yes gene_type:complete